MNRSGLAVLEITTLGAALVILDKVDKASSVQVLQAELNDYYGYLIKLQGDSASLRTAVDVAERTAAEMQAQCITAIIDAPDARAWSVIESKPEHSPLIEQNVVFFPHAGDSAASGRPSKSPSKPSRKSGAKGTMMSSQPPFAIGLIETQGFTAVIDAIDTACKAGDVEVLGKEKLGGGYITILLKGDVAAVNAAIEAGKARVPALGKLIAAHVIARPSDAVLSLLPKL